MPGILGCGARPAPQNAGSGEGVGWKCEPPGRTLPLPGFSIFCEHRFVVVVGEWIFEPWFSLPAVAERRRRDHRLVWFGWLAGGVHAHTGFPQFEVAQDAFYDSGLVDEGDERIQAARLLQRRVFGANSPGVREACLKKSK